MSIAKQIADMSGGRVTEEDAQQWADAVDLTDVVMKKNGACCAYRDHTVGIPLRYWDYDSFSDLVTAIEKHRDAKKKPADNRTWQEKVEAAVQKFSGNFVRISYGGDWASFAAPYSRLTIQSRTIRLDLGADAAMYVYILDYNKLVDCLHAEGLTGYKKYRQVD